MKLQHALGGLEGLGPLGYERRVFVQAWETRIFGIHVALMGLSSSLRGALPGYDLDATGTTFATPWTWADLRKGAEAMNPLDYFKFRYYERWLAGISGYCVEQGYITADELDAATSHFRDETDAPLPVAAAGAIDAQVIRYLREGDSARRSGAKPRFRVGDRVRVANPPTGSHTRLPGYLRNKVGVVESTAEGTYTYFCSTGGDGLGDPVPVHVVCFSGEELFGEVAETNPSPVYAELYEPYLTTLHQ
ncbi:nitrile hydratase subunit beta [Mycobacterium sp. Aquia_216]|uniref:nitrile hydratase subunit beta n=1 Tax=Mycobacterium sp. Aquia_216 TaxID=2991729 RepID=UPI00227BCB73|nr:nitrile hydratase subunit beta [Mycobacterium sp. Aquia_216]WAJ43029.1 nitrile hydratase subunit beta [Mycobacterium sp. Aquia_216]